MFINRKWFFFKLRLKINQNIPGPVSMISNFRVFMKTNSFYFRGKKVNKSYVTIFANQGQFSLDAYFKKLVRCMLHENNYITVLLTTNSTLYSLNGIKCNMYFLIYDIHDCINWALVDVHTVDLNLTKMYIFFSRFTQYASS